MHIADKIRKIEALIAGAKSDGEPQAFSKGRRRDRYCRRTSSDARDFSSLSHFS